MQAFFEYAALVKHHDPITMPDRAQTVGNDEAGAARKQFHDSLLNEGFARFIDIGGGFIEDENPRVPQQHRLEAATP